MVYYLHEKAWHYFMMPHKRERAPLRQSSYGRERAPCGGLFKGDVALPISAAGLEAIEAAPSSWAVTFALGENPREVALVNKATELGQDIGQRLAKKA